MKKRIPKWDENLRLISVCPVCERNYGPAEAKELAADGGARLLHITCKGCTNSVIALILTDARGISSLGLATDLTYHDFMKFRTNPTVCPDDVLEIHGVLEDERRFWRAVGARH